MVFYLVYDCTLSFTTLVYYRDKREIIQDFKEQD